MGLTDSLGLTDVPIVKDVPRLTDFLSFESGSSSRLTGSSMTLLVSGIAGVVTGIVGASRGDAMVVGGISRGCRSAEVFKSTGGLEVTGFRGAVACQVPLLATFETGIGAAEVCSFFVGKFLQSDERTSSPVSPVV